MITLYGIPNCDTIRKARSWLKEHQIEYRFHNFKTDGVDEDTLQHWCSRIDWELLLNKRGSTWRNLSEKERKITGQEDAIQRLAQYPSMIKRPVLVHGNDMEIGFNPTKYEQFFKKA